MSPIVNEVEVVGLIARKERIFEFNQTKAIQAVAFLLKQKHPTNSDNFMRVLKLLYFADRKSIEETGSPITGDRFVAMEHGPTLSHLVDLVNQRTFNNSEWDEYIEKDEYEIRLIKDPGNGKLCRYEIDLLKSIWEENRELGEWEVAMKSEKLPEWVKNNPGSSSCFIPLSDLLDAIGKSGWLKEILESAAESAEARHLFGANS